MNIKKVICVASLIVAGFGASAIASEKYVNVGFDSSGDPFLLDTTTMGKRERGFGEVIKVYQVKGDLMLEMLLHPSCGDNRMWSVGSRIYNNGVKVDESKEQQEIQFQAGTPAGESMRYYCHSIGARGW